MRKSFFSRIIIKLAFIASLMLNSVNAVASGGYFDRYFIDSDDGMLDSSRYLAEVPFGFLPVPIIITEPAVGNGLGVVGVFFHESDEQKKKRISLGEKTSRAILPENISMLGIAGTENGTRGLGVGHLGFWFKDTLRYKGLFLFGSLNIDYYSLGGSELPTPIELNSEGPIIIQELKRRVGKSHFFAGARQIYRQVDISLTETINLNPFPTPGLNNQLNNFLNSQTSSSTTTSGLGLLLEYDSRNNPFNPETGYDFVFDYMIFDESIGSDVNYDAFNFTALNYWSLNSSFNLAVRFQYDGVVTDESLPPYITPSIDLRGVPAVRYQGDDVALAEIELSWKFDKRWKFNTFTGEGRAADSFNNLSSAKAVRNVGAGFRYLIAKRYGFIMGVDIAKGPEDSAFYIQAGSTWN